VVLDELHLLPLLYGAVFNLEFVRLKIRTEGLPEGAASELRASTVRGAFGKALREVACVKPSVERCLDCPLADSCPYSYVFETPIGAAWRQYPYLPHPFVLGFSRDNPQEFTITLIGRGVNYLDPVLAAVEVMGRRGVGRGRAKFRPKVFSGDKLVFERGREVSRPQRVSLGEYALRREARGEIRLKFITMARIVFRGKLLRSFSREGFIASLARRLRLLNIAHGADGAPPPFRLDELLEGFEVLGNSTYPAQYEEYSGRQGRVIRFQGFRGEVKLLVKSPLAASLLAAGEVIHVGKGTSYGFGEYEIKEVSP